MEPNPIIEFLASESTTLFILQLFGTFLGALFGFGLVITWDRRKKETERKETRNMIIDSLVAELKENLEGLNNFKMPVWNVVNGQFTGRFGLASISAFQSVISGGNFVMLPTTLQKTIIEIYQHAELFNKFMDNIIGFSTFNLTPAQASIATTEQVRRLQEQKSELQPSIPKTIKELKSLRKKK